MGPAMHAASPSYPPPPNFYQNNADIVMNGVQQSHSALNSFDGPHSMASTPTPTPPTSRHQQNAPYNPPYGQMNGSFGQQNTPRPFNDLKHNVHQQQYPPGQKPQIYTAVYSGVSVYEMEVNSVAVMRRRKDSWLNATQILKVAGIDKGKRTKVLEREILSGEHEKVQGGYGRYQGTWINYLRGVEFARQYGVEGLLRPLFDYDMGRDGVIAGSGDLNTPTKEQAMAAQRKRNMMNGGIDSRAPAQSPNGTFFKNISTSAANAVNAISKARFESSTSGPSSQNRPTKPMRRSSQQLSGSQDSAYAGSSQQSMQSLHSENSFGTSQLDPALRDLNAPYFSNSQSLRRNSDVNEPPRKRVRHSPPQDPFSQPTDGNFDTSMRELTPTEVNGSFLQPYESSQLNLEYPLNGLPPLPQPDSDPATEKQQMLTSLFLDPTQTDFSNHPALLHLTGEDLDIPIDSTAHTALHWAATLASVSLLRALINKGASIYRLNGGGETALIRAALTTNNLDQGSFPELLELLGPTIEIRDGQGRTVLHHIAVSSAVKNRGSASRYYLESLLEFVVRQGSAANSQQNSFIEPPGAPLINKSIGLAKFMADIVNAGDMSGDTALNLAARIGNKSIIQQLLEVGANPTIPNRGGLKPVDFGVGGDLDLTDSQSDNQLARLEKYPVGKVVDSSQELMHTMSALLSDTESSLRSEVQTKQSLIEQTHVKLRETTAFFSEDRHNITELEHQSDEHKTLYQNKVNLQLNNGRKRTRLSSNQRSGTKPLNIRTDIKVGEADAGLEMNKTVLHDPKEQPIVAPQQRENLASLPGNVVLHARATAYGKRNVPMDAGSKDLQSQSSGLENHLKKVVNLCTGVEESRCDEMVDGLSAAVASECGNDVEVGRVREFLRRVDGVAEA
ncbi:transcriptional regulator swi6 [Lecanora helva]